MALAIKPDERNKVILLGSLTGIVLVVGIARTLSALKSSGSSSDTGAASASANGNNNISTTLSTSGAPLLSNGMPGPVSTNTMSATMNASRLDDLYADSTPGSTIVRDPFAPIAPPHTPQPVSPAPRPAAPNRVVNGGTMIEPNNQGFPTQRTFGNPARTGSVPSLPTFTNPANPTIVQQAAPQISLAGVILGQPSMAVLMVNARPYELTVGQKLPQGYRVTGISDTAVSLKKGNRTYRLEVGRALNGQAPGNLPMAPSTSPPTAIAIVPSAGPTMPLAPEPEPLTPRAPTNEQAQDNPASPEQTVRPVQSEDPAPDAEPPK